MGNTHTEEEAKRKSCPFKNNPGMNFCDGAACMAWRWADGPRTIAFNKAVMDRAEEKSIGWSKAHHEMMNEVASFDYTEGYCGGAGFPNQFIN